MLVKLGKGTTAEPKYIHGSSEDDGGDDDDVITSTTTVATAGVAKVDFRVTAFKISESSHV